MERNGNQRQIGKLLAEVGCSKQQEANGDISSMTKLGAKTVEVASTYGLLWPLEGGSHSAAAPSRNLLVTAARLPSNNKLEASTLRSQTLGPPKSILFLLRVG